MKSKLDPFHLQIVSHYFKTKIDLLNVIQITKKYQYLLDRFRINPIPITNKTKNLFHYLDTQQLFNNVEEQIILDEIQILQIPYEISYSTFIELKVKYNQFNLTSQNNFKIKKP